MTALAEAAVVLAERGSLVFPVGPDKAPRTPRGHHDATSDLEQVLDWGAEGLFDGGGIGLVVPERTFVLDVDPRNGGLETMEALLRAQSEPAFPRTRLVRTQSGGWHYYLALPDDRELRGKLGPGVDIKKPGRGYVLVPPTPGYSYIRGGKPVLAPDWLLEELTQGQRAAGVASGPKFSRFQTGTAYGLTTLRNATERVRAQGEGGRRALINTEAFVLASLSAGGELDEEKAFEALLEAALDAGLDEGQALKAMNSGWDAGLRNPRQAE